jgi:hypothetical protein
MPYVPVPKDFSKVKVKILFGLTKRQIISFGLGALIGVPVFLLTRKALGNSTSMILMVVLMAPFFFLGMYERDGLPAEKMILSIIRTKYWPGIRCYKTENLYEYKSEKEGRKEATPSGSQHGKGKPGGKSAERAKKEAGRVR